MSLSPVFFCEPSSVQTLIFKPSLLCMEWMKFTTSKEERSCIAWSRSNSILGWMDMPKKIFDLSRAIACLDPSKGTREYTETILRVFKKFTSLIGLWVGGVYIGNEEGLFSLSQRQFAFLGVCGFFGSLALFLKSIFDINKNLNELFYSEEAQCSFKVSCLYLAKKICCLVTGLFGMLAFAFGGEVFSKGVILGISTLSLSLSILKYYSK